jgi:hypothetical protein
MQTEQASFRDRQIAAIEKWLHVFIAPGQAVELRALHVGGKKAICEVFGDLHALAGKAADLDAAGARGVYFTPNPIRPDLLGSRASANDQDVIRRRWLLIDCDAFRPAGLSATLEERTAAWSVMGSVFATLQAWGMSGAVTADSGNGYHLNYPIDLPNDDATKTLIQSFLKALAAQCGDAISPEEKKLVKEGQCLSVPKAIIDTSVYNASRIWKLPGTRSKKGEATFDRPHRWAQLIDGMAWSAETAQANNAALPKVLQVLRRILEIRRGRPETNEKTYAQAALRQECQAVVSAEVGERNNQLFKSAAALAELVAAGALTESEVTEQLEAVAKQAGLEASEIAATIRSGFKHGTQKPRDLSGLGASNKEQEAPPNKEQQAPPKSERPKITMENIASIDDLIAVGAEVAWVWPNWIQTGVLTAIAAKGGTGKTRFCADLLRRIRHGKGWPDGTAIALASDALSLWVVSDNHHDEMVSLAQAFGIKDSIRINAYKADPYGGVCLDAKQDLEDLEARIAILRPALVVIDTVGNATDKNLCKQEDAKAFYFPLQIRARRYRTAILCLMHLNADNQFLGRRVLEKVRVAIRMEQPDQSNDRRRLEVVKSNAKRPPALGVTMGDFGNEYDTNPPQSMEEEVRHGLGRPPEKFDAAVAWLTGDWLRHMAKRVSVTRTEGELRGYSAKTLYAVLKAGLIEEFEDDKGKKWWKLPDAKQSSGNAVS